MSRGPSRIWRTRRREHLSERVISRTPCPPASSRTISLHRSTVSFLCDIAPSRSCSWHERYGQTASQAAAAGAGPDRRKSCTRGTCAINADRESKVRALSNPITSSRCEPRSLQEIKSFCDYVANGLGREPPSFPLLVSDTRGMNVGHFQPSFLVDSAFTSRL